MSSTVPLSLRPKLWLVGGTSEGIALAAKLQQCGVPTIVTVTTEAACLAYQAYPDIAVQTIRFSTDDMLANWLRQSNIKGVLDASHPFATDISSRAIQVSQHVGISYLRFERAAVTPLQSAHVTDIDPSLHSLSRDVLSGQRVLLTVGSQGLGQFAQWHDCADLFARILPTERAFKLAVQAGFRRDRLIALQPPLSFELEYALWRHWDISLVITKASGQAGGEDIKRKVASALNIPLMILQRPPMDYPWQTQSVRTATNFARQITQTA